MLAHDVIAPLDVPPFDRANVDGFALRAADTGGANDGAPKQLTLNAEVIACGHAPEVEVRPGTATAIATGGVVPRGADAVVMIEQTELIDSVPRDRNPPCRLAGQFILTPGSDIARGETLLRRGQRIGSREIGMLAACGLADIDVVRKPKVAVLSTGDELVAGRAAAAGRRLRQQRRDPRRRHRRGRRRTGAAWRIPDDEAALGKRCARARRLRHGGAVRRHLEGRRRSVAPHRVEARRARASWCMASR